MTDPLEQLFRYGRPHRFDPSNDPNWTPQEGRIGFDTIQPYGFLEPGSVDTAQLVDLAITSTKITDGSISTPKLAANAITAAKLAVGLIPIQNLLTNGGFRNGLTGWIAGSGGAPGFVSAIWNTTLTDWTLADGDVDNWSVGGNKGSTAYMTGTNTASAFTCTLAQVNVPVTGSQFYSASALLGVHRLTSARIQIDWYDAASAYISSSSSPTVSAPSAGNGGPNLSGWNYVTIDGAQAPSNARFATFYIVANPPNISGTDWYLFIDQVWLGVGLVAQKYQPQEGAYARDPLGNVTIDASGITILNGKIALQDAFGNSVLSASGFAGSWLSFLQSGLMYNSDFSQGSTSDVAVTEVGSGAGAANYAASITSGLPYWVVAASGGTVKCVTDSGATGSRALDLSGSGSQTNRVYQDVPVRPLLNYSALMSLKSVHLDAAGDHFRVYFSWRDSDHQLIGSRVLNADMTGLGAFAYASLFPFETDRLQTGGTGTLPIAPANAYYLRVEVETVHATATYVLDVSEVNVFPTMPFMSDVTTGALTVRGTLSALTSSVTSSTPTISGGGTGVFGSKVAKYTQVGKLVTAHLGFTVTTAGSGATAVTVTATGFPRPDGSSGFVVVGDRATTGAARIVARLADSGSDITLIAMALMTTPTTSLTGVDMALNARYDFNFAYLAA